MSRPSPILLKVLIAVATVAAGGVSVGHAAEDATAAIEKANKAFMAAVKRGDTTALSNMYTTNAKALPPNSGAVSGRADIGALWGSAIASGVGGLELKSTEVETHGDTAIEVGTVQILDKSGASIGRGKYLVVWKRENGAWKLHRDIWNMDSGPVMKEHSPR
jgi:ketosteroid isomerase-like protein